MSELKRLEPRIVFNLTECSDSDRNPGHASASLLGMIPQTPR